MAEFLRQSLVDSPTPDEKIVCILQRKGPKGHPTRYDVIGLRELAPEQVAADSDPWCLTCYQATELPQPLLDHFLVEEVPEYLQGGATRKLHYIVSTHSGTGRALEFYRLVLGPLTEAVRRSCAERESGNGRARAEVAQAQVATSHFDLTVTTDAGSIRRVARELAGPGGGEHTVVLLSGDGGVVELLNGMASDDPPNDPGASLPLIALLPFGTGNALFHSLHKPLYGASDPSPSPLVLGLRTLFHGQPAPLPSFTATFSPGSRTISYTEPDESPRGNVEKRDGEEHTDAITHLHGAIVASYGFHAQLVWESDTPAYRRHGAKRFGMVAAELLEESHAYRATVEVTVPGEHGAAGHPRKIETATGRHAYVLATLVSNLEKTFTISPAGRPLDGRLRLVHFGATSGERTMEVMKAAYDEGRHVGMTWEAGEGGREGVGYEEIGEVRVTMEEEDERWRKVCVDGLIVEVPRGGSMCVRREGERLRVLVDRSIPGKESG